MVGLSLLHTFLNIDCCYVVRSEGSIYNNLIMEYLSILFGSFSNWKYGEFFSTYKGRCIYHFFQDLSWLSYGCLCIKLHLPRPRLWYPSAFEVLALLSSSSFTQWILCNWGCLGMSEPVQSCRACIELVLAWYIILLSLFAPKSWQWVVQPYQLSSSFWSLQWVQIYGCLFPCFPFVQ